MLQDAGSESATDSAAATDTSASASASASEVAQTSWPIEIYVQPDPRAASVDSSATVDALGEADALAAVKAVAGDTYGSVTAVAAVVTEAAVDWDGSVTGESGEKSVKLSGKLTAAGYVYCMQRDPARMLQEASASATEGSASAADATEGSGSDSAAASTEGSGSEKAPAKTEYPMMRAEVKAEGDFGFVMTMTGFGDGEEVNWAC